MVSKSVLFLWFVFIMKQGNTSSHLNHGERTGTLLREVRNFLRRRTALLNAIYTHAATAIKTVWSWCKKPNMDQWNKIEISERKLHTCGHLIFDNKGKTIQWREDNLFNKWFWEKRPDEGWKIDAFELWCWRRLLRVPWVARRSNQCILKEISPGYSLEGLMLKLKLQYFGHLMRRVDSLEKTLMLGGIGDRMRRGW